MFLRGAAWQSAALVGDVAGHGFFVGPQCRGFAAGADMRDAWRQVKIGRVEEWLHGSRWMMDGLRQIPPGGGCGYPLAMTLARRRPPGLSAWLRHAGYRVLPMTWDACERANALPLDHKDPMDRMLIALAAERGMTVITDDEVTTKCSRGMGSRRSGSLVVVRHDRAGCRSAVDDDRLARGEIPGC